MMFEAIRKYNELLAKFLFAVEEKPEIIPYELEPIEEEIVRQVEATHPQLSPLITFELALTRVKEVGLLSIAPTGEGKSRALEAVMPFTNHILKDQFLEIGNIAPSLSNAQKDILIDDATTLILSDKWEQHFSIIASLLFKHGSEDYGIKNCLVNIIINLTPELLQKLTETTIWTGQLKDRFIRYYLIYHKKPDIQSGELRLNLDIPKANSEPPFEVSQQWYDKVSGMLRSQLSDHRARLMARKLMTGHAILCGKSKVDDKDAMWLYLYKPVITVDELFQAKVFDKRIPFVGRRVTLNDLITFVCEVCKRPTDVSYFERRYPLSHYLTLCKFDIKENEIDLGTFGQELEHLYRTFSTQPPSQEKE
jgi:hypothetical protein